VFAVFANLFAKLPRPADIEVTFAVFKSRSNLLLPVHSKVETIPLNALLQDATSELADLSSHYLFLMLNVKQGSC